MSTSPRRPISIWIAQILILIAGVPLSIVALFAVLRDVMFIGATQITALTVIGLMLSTIFRLGLVALFFFAFWGLARRRKYGRWLSVAIVVLMIIFSIAGQVFRPSGPVEYYEYENSAERVGGMFGAAVVYGLLGLLLYHLCFSDSVADFFNPEMEQNQLDVPPPPETYLLDSERIVEHDATN